MGVFSGTDFLLVTPHWEKYRVYISGISTPQVGGKGRTARQTLHGIINGYSVRVSVINARSPNGEGHVKLGSSDVAERLIHRGVAKADRSAPEHLRKAQALRDSMYPSSRS